MHTNANGTTLAVDVSTVPDAVYDTYFTSDGFAGPVQLVGDDGGTSTVVEIDNAGN
jgi:hypothetical protein